MTLRQHEDHPLDNTFKKSVGQELTDRIKTNKTVHKAAEAGPNNISDILKETDKLLKEYHENTESYERTIAPYAALKIVLMNKSIPLSNDELSTILSIEKNHLASRAREIAQHVDDYKIAPVPLKYWVKRRKKEVLVIGDNTEVEEKIKTLQNQAQKQPGLQGRPNNTLSAAILYKAVKTCDNAPECTAKQIAHITRTTKATVLNGAKKLDCEETA